MGQRFRQIGETKFALDEHGHDVLSYSASDVQSFDPVSIEFVLCRIAMVEVDLGAERRWAFDSDSQFLVEKALYGLDNGLDVDDAMSAAVAQREASAERRASSEHQPATTKQGTESYADARSDEQSTRERRAPRGCQGDFDGPAWRMVARETFGGHSARRHSARDCFCPPTRPRVGFGVDVRLVVGGGGGLWRGVWGVWVRLLQFRTCRRTQLSTSPATASPGRTPRFFSMGQAANQINQTNYQPKST